MRYKTVNNHNYMENNIQVQKAADISSLAGVVIVSLSALTAYNIGEKFNHNILFDATIFIISLVMLILTFAIPQSNGRAFYDNLK